MSLIVQREHEYLIDFSTAAGDRWFFHFRADQVHEVIRRSLTHYRRGHFSEDDLLRFNRAVADIVEIEKLPPATEACKPQCWYDKLLCLICGGR